MRRRFVLAMLVVLAAGFMLGACSEGIVKPGGTPVEQMSWADITLIALQEDNFLGYLIPLVLAIVGLSVGWSRLRYAILAFSVVYLGFFLGLRISGLGAPSTFILFLHSIRPNWSFYLTWVVLIIVGMLAGRVFCGWVCPMGAVQQFFYRRDQSFTVSDRVHRWLRWLRYVVLAVLVVTVWAFSARYWGPWDPFRTLFRMQFTAATIGPMVLMVMVLAASIFFFAPWCLYVCPLGAFLALLARVSPFKVRLDASRCSDCQRCASSYCSYQAIKAGDESTKPHIDYFECTACGECVAKCPDKALSFRASAGKSKEETARKLPETP